MPSPWVGCPSIIHDAWPLTIVVNMCGECHATFTLNFWLISENSRHIVATIKCYNLRPCCAILPSFLYSIHWYDGNTTVSMLQTCSLTITSSNLDIWNLVGEFWFSLYVVWAYTFEARVWTPDGVVLSDYILICCLCFLL